MKVPDILIKILISVSVACLTAAISFVVGVFIHTSIGTNDTIISGYFSAAGGVFGGAIGGVVAFYAAKTQIDDLHQTRYEERQRKYLKILEAIISENLHNISLLKTIVATLKVNAERAIKYEQLLESEVWHQVKFDENNLLQRDTFARLNKEHREYRDMRSKVLKEYQEDRVPYEDLISTLEFINQDLNKEIEVTENQIPNNSN